MKLISEEEFFSIIFVAFFAFLFPPPQAGMESEKWLPQIWVWGVQWACSGDVLLFAPLLRAQWSASVIQPCATFGHGHLLRGVFGLSRKSDRILARLCEGLVKN